MDEPGGGGTRRRLNGTPRAASEADARSRPGATPIRILIVDHQPVLLRGVRSVLEAEPGFSVVAESANGSDVADLVHKLTPDVLVLDLDLPDGGALAVADSLFRAKAPTRVVLFATTVSEGEFLRSRQLGVKGLVLKSMPPHLLVQCVRTVHAGEEFVERETLLRALTRLERRTAGTHPRADATLTTREREIQRLVADGLSNKEIAARLNCGPGTVKAHLQRVYDKLGVHSRYGLMRLGEGTDPN